jgi:glycosyltransferase involved in cell wall biosynthesis
MSGRRITIVPLIESEVELQDVLARMAWAIGLASFHDVVIFTADAALGSVEWRVPESMDPAIAAIFPALRPRVRIVAAPTAADILERVAESDVILVVKDPPEIPGISAEAWAEAIRGRRVFAADAARTRQEFGNWIEVNFLLRADRDAESEQCRARFTACLAEVGRAETAYCLATGPSLAAFKETNFEGAISVVCNSAILDEELMEWVRPRFLVFADPIFHYGPSKYAAAFRAKLRESCGRHDYTIIVPQKYYGLITDAMPELRSRTIGIPSDKPSGFNLDLEAEFRVFTTANILTYLMLPLASTVARKIYVLGCDGRPLNQDAYFWTHNKRTQINDQMENIQGVHPGFFAIDYNDYYLDHCRLLDELISEGEKTGREYGTVTPSFIPALERRPANLPRTLIIDFTELGARNATGQLKATLFKRWAPEKILQIRPLSTRDATYFRLHTLADHPPLREAKFTSDEVLRECLDFEPELIYFRPTDSPPEFFELGMELVKRLGVPVVSHVMDDWPERLRETNPATFARIDSPLRELFATSAVRLGISDAMADAYRERYGCEFVPIANGIDPADWPEPPASRRADEPLVIRYSGGLTDDMTLASVEQFARVVSALSREIAIRFEIYALPAAIKIAQETFRDLPAVTVLPSVEWADYPKLLGSAGALLIAYNFDDRTRTYTQYSMANKLPECLASGVPLIVFGPPSIATVRRAADLGAAVLVDTPDETRLRESLLELSRQPDLFREKALAARARALAELNVDDIRKKFQDLVARLPRATGIFDGMLLGPYSRLQRMALNDCEVAAQFFATAASTKVAVVFGEIAPRLLKQFVARGWDVLVNPSVADLSARYPVETRAIVLRGAGGAIPPAFPLVTVAALVFATEGSNAEDDWATAQGLLAGKPARVLWSARYPLLGEQWPPDYRGLREVAAPGEIPAGQPGVLLALDPAAIQCPRAIKDPVLYLRKAWYAGLSGGGKTAKTFAWFRTETLVTALSPTHLRALLAAVLRLDVRRRLMLFWRESRQVERSLQGRLIVSKTQP